MKNLVVLTGAGMSAESGISTFRDAGGLWDKYPVEQVATPEGYQRDPALVINFYNERRKQLLEVKPNRGHELLAELEKSFHVTVVTQNVDNLHERAGSSHIIHLHGELTKVCSSRDPYNPQFIKELKPEEYEVKMGDKAGDGTQLRPFIVWFGEAVPEIETAIRYVEKADDTTLELDFNYKDYSFLIQTRGKSFKFTELSAGYSAALDIVADLILKMQSQNNVVRAYEKEGIVLIDEIETHLHLELQRVILPILTTIFPNIQFVVTTHSPFILNSLENAIAFDLEHREPIEDLTDYSYEALAEGYFGVRTDSSEIQMRLQRMEELIRSDRLSISDKSELEMYLQDFDKIPEAVAPAVKAKYYDLKREWQNKN